jgi:general secretion pathway protein B
MSYILDALEKVERERSIEQVPDLGAHHEPIVYKKRSRWMWIAAASVLGVLSLVALLWMALGDKESVSAHESTAAIIDSRTPETEVTFETATDAGLTNPPLDNAVGPAAQPSLVEEMVEAATQPLQQQLTPLPLPLPGLPPPKETKLERATQVAKPPNREDVWPPLSEQPPFESAEGPGSAKESETKSPAVIDEAALTTGSNAALPSPVLESTRQQKSGWMRLPIWPRLHRALSQHVDGGLVLNGHVYTAAPEERFVLINMRKYFEGDRIAEGPRLEQITREGVILAVPDGRFRVVAE